MINLCLPKQRLKLEKRGIEQNITNYDILCDCFIVLVNIVREPAILLIKWLRPNGLKVCSYIETYAEKIKFLKKMSWYTKMLCATVYPGVGNFSN